MGTDTHPAQPQLGPEINWAKVEEVFHSIQPGELCQGCNGSYYIKPVQSKAHHLDCMLINLLTGQIEHFANTYGLKPVTWHEIVW